MRAGTFSGLTSGLAPGYLQGNLLVVPHPNYDSFEFDGTWAWARKKSDTASVEDRSDVVSAIYEQTSAARRSFLVRRYLKKLFRVGG